MSDKKKIKSVAIVGAGAAGAITAAAFKAENYFEHIEVFERRGTAGGTWIYDPDPKPGPVIRPGSLPPDLDPPLKIPSGLPRITPSNQQERFEQTPIYESLTTNVPDIAMCFSDRRFAYGPFVPHYVPRQYVESYFPAHGTDSLLTLNTTVEDISKVAAPSSAGGDGGGGLERWKLTLRKYDAARHVDVWWEQVFDAVILANGHYSVPYIPHVDGLEAYMRKFPGRVTHSKQYRSPAPYASKRVLVIGNSASGRDVAAELVTRAALPVYQSRRSKSRWDGDAPPPGIAWRPVVRSYDPASGRVVFADGTYLNGVDAVIYCTGYRPSFPFWNANAGPLWDYGTQHLRGAYWHTFVRSPGHRAAPLGVVGLPRVLTFRSFEYQAVALARLFSGRNAVALPPVAEQEAWERRRLEESRRTGRKFHDIQWETGETAEWLGFLFRIAGLGTLRGEGRIPPPLTKELVWAVEHIKKYPEPGKGKDGKVGERGDSGVVEDGQRGDGEESEWVLVERGHKDLLGFL